tara:strand:- start:2816 stop:4909 length:2094 start_codon:yes stop_codon:yes gene_type:complete
VNPIVKSFQYGQHTVTLETGVMARQADAAVLASMGDTTVLATVVGKKEVDASRDFFPLTVNYQEKSYATGQIPGGFFKREGRPGESETLVARLIDRPLRPLFPNGFTNEIQVVLTVVSIDAEINPDIVAMIGASAALSISGIPFNGPMGAARVGYINGEYVLNPESKMMEESTLDLIVAGTEQAVLMVESEANILPEDVMLGAVIYGHEQSKVMIDAITAFQQEAGKEAWDWQSPEINMTLAEKVKALSEEQFGEAYRITLKKERSSRVQELKKSVVQKLVEEDEACDPKEVEQLLSKVEKDVVRSRVIAGEPRIDGRDPEMIRALSVLAGVLPRTHGSSLFTRGETQALVTATLGTEKDAQIVETFGTESRDQFILHYNFPPYCVGETGMMGSPKRREIGHGNLAKRGIKAVLPSQSEFPYTVRVVSEITESNGSSSMASVCGSSLALMDAGVPIKSSVAGIAMGLVKDEAGNFVVLSDILGDEDHLGDMDFKVAGTAEGVTALQMDIKIEGITPEIMKIALKQAHSARIHILKVMDQAIDTPRVELSTHAPRITTIKINPDKIRDVIGKGGANIRALTEETGVTIDIEDDGTVKIASSDGAASKLAIEKIKAITADVEVGAIYTGKVNRIVEFGAFVNILPGKDGLVHISQITAERVNDVSEHLAVGQEVKVKVLEIDRQGRIRLSMKEVSSVEA